MKTILTTTFVAISLIYNLYYSATPNFSNASFNDVKADTVKKISFDAKQVEECAKPTCIKKSLEKAKTLKSYILIYKIKNNWVITKDKKQYQEVLGHYKPTQISILHGDVHINNKPVQEKYAVILTGKSE